MMQSLSDVQLLQRQWERREEQFAAFLSGPLATFWQQRQTGEFLGVDRVTIRYVKFVDPQHEQAIVIVTGRSESYIKYQELAYDLFHSGYDVLMMDHRGQGFSGRMLADSERGHVVRFMDYIDDLSTFWRQVVLNHNYRHIYMLAHSMGGAICTLFLAQQAESETVTAAVLTAPMAGIKLPLPVRAVKSILALTEYVPWLTNYYAVGSGRWRALPFSLNVLTQSKLRYQFILRCYQDTPQIRLGGPTNHWLRESLQAGEQMIATANQITTPLLVLQAEKDQLVDNPSQVLFCQAMADAGHPVAGQLPQMMVGAKHEIFFERDGVRTEALRRTLHFFSTQC